jgi:hypothetical protein
MNLDCTVKRLCSEHPHSSCLPHGSAAWRCTHLHDDQGLAASSPCPT